MGSFVLEVVVRRFIGIVLWEKAGGMMGQLLMGDLVSYAFLHGYLLSGHEFCTR